MLTSSMRSTIVKIWVGEVATIKIKHARIRILQEILYENQLRNQHTCMISVKNLSMKSSCD